MIDNTREIGTIWGFVVDKRFWNVSHIVVQIGKGLEDQKILISEQAFQKPLILDRGFLVSLSGGRSGTKLPDDSADLSACSYVTKLEVCLGPPNGWALVRPMPWPAFPMPMVSSFYVKENASSTQGEQKCDVRPQSCRDLIGSPVKATDGGAGVIDDLLLDDDYWLVRYVVLDTGRWFPGRKVILSTSWLKHTSEDDSTLLVDLTSEAVKDGPTYDPGVPINRELESGIFAHYDRRPYWV